MYRGGTTCSSGVAFQVWLYIHVLQNQTHSHTDTYTHCYTQSYRHIHTLLHTVIQTHTHTATHSHTDTYTHCYTQSYRHIHTLLHTVIQTHTHTTTHSHTDTYTHCYIYIARVPWWYYLLSSQPFQSKHIYMWSGRSSMNTCVMECMLHMWYTCVHCTYCAL